MAEEVPYWMKRFEQQDLDEEKEPLVKPLDVKARKFIWWLCKQYKFMYNGVMGQACNLLERYMAKKSMTFFISAPRLLLKRRREYNDMSSRIPLLASVCVGLTTKMMSSETQLESSSIRTVLLRLNENVTLAAIYAAEMEVLSTLNFHIPLFTNVEKALIIADDVGMKSDTLLQGVSLVTEVAEYHRSDIQHEVIKVAFSICPEGDVPLSRDAITNIRHIHLVAGALIATRRYLKDNGPDPTPRLCFLTQTTDLYINCIGNIIHKRLVLAAGKKPLFAVFPFGKPSFGEPSLGEPSTSKRKTL